MAFFICKNYNPLVVSFNFFTFDNNIKNKKTNIIEPKIRGVIYKNILKLPISIKITIVNVVIDNKIEIKTGIYILANTIKAIIKLL